MSAPLTDGINALTAYANEITGESDTSLSDAVHTLANGYGGGIVDELFEVKHKITLNANANKLTFPFFGNGMYVVITSPVLTSQMAIDAQTDYLWQSGAFLFYGVANAVLNSNCYLYKKNGNSDYWGTNISIDANKTTITMKAGNGGVTFLGGLDYYILMPKES